jgi:hypothetical protein
VCDFGQKGEEVWKEMRGREEEMSRLDLRMGMIYEMKNDYESKFYNSKNKLAELRPYASKTLLEEIEKHILIAEHWIEEEHAKPVVATEGDFKKYEQKNN